MTALTEIAWLFLRLGTTAFGGPAAHIAMMDDEVVRRRGWLSREQFIDFLGATNLIPGPNSSELAMHVGHARGGWKGLIVAGVCFILPAAGIVSGIAALYVRYGTLPVATGLLYGVKAVTIAIVAQALYALGRTALTSGWHVVVAIAVAIAVVAGVNEIATLAAAGVLMLLLHRVRVRRAPGGMASDSAGNDRAVAGFALSQSAGTVGATSAAVAAGVTVAAPFGLWPLFTVFLKIGAVVFGSGYVLLAFLREDLVQRLGWLTEQQLLDAIAVGQITPGPLFTAATFVGYLLAGPAGATVGTVGIFLPAFVFVALSGPLVPRIRRSPSTGAILDGVNVASLALMAVVSLQLARAALLDIPTILIAAVSMLLLHRRINSVWLILAGAIAGLLLRG
ncbi:MAG TPA: chromate efflux transporter [Gemmatimonas sp.]|nr:chromate efflux transporter [Gemmatimonas sp.]